LEQLELQLPVQVFRLQSLALVEADHVPDQFSGAFRVWDLGSIPYYWGTYDQGVITQSLELLNNRSLIADAEVRFSLPKPGVKATYLDLDAQIAGDQPVNMIVSYGKGETKLGAFTLRISPGAEARYRIRALSRHQKAGFRRFAPQHQPTLTRASRDRYRAWALVSSFPFSFRE